jgi:hypothetical protein
MQESLIILPVTNVARIFIKLIALFHKDMDLNLKMIEGKNKGKFTYT